MGAFGFAADAPGSCNLSSAHVDNCNWQLARQSVDICIPQLAFAGGGGILGFGSDSAPCKTEASASDPISASCGTGGTFGAGASALHTRASDMRNMMSALWPPTFTSKTGGGCLHAFCACCPCLRLGCCRRDGTRILKVRRILRCRIDIKGVPSPELAQAPLLQARLPEQVNCCQPSSMSPSSSRSASFSPCLLWGKRRNL